MIDGDLETNEWHAQVEHFYSFKAEALKKNLTFTNEPPKKPVATSLPKPPTKEERKNLA